MTVALSHTLDQHHPGCDMCSLQHAKGDVKKKGVPDPYAYIPLDRQKLNRRKKAKLSGQFKHIVGGAVKGSLAGARKRHKKR